MNVLSVTAHNVMGVKDVRLDLEGHHLFLVGGKNGQGKTSVLKSLLVAICGRSGMDYPARVLRDGESEGYITVQLSPDPDMPDDKGMTIQLKLVRRPVRRGGETTEEVVEEFTVLDSTGDEAPTPRHLLRDLYRSRAFDPLAFARMKPQDQRDTLCEMLGIDLSQMKERYDEIYADRRTITRQGHQEKALAEALPHYPDAPPEPVKVADLVERLAEAGRHNKSIADGKSTIAKAASENAAHEAEISKLRAKIKKLTERMAANDQLSADASKSIEGKEPIDTTPIQAEIERADEVNSQVQANVDRAKAFAKVEELRAERVRLTEDLDAIIEEQKKFLESIDWPLPGMSVTDDCVTIDGIPLQDVNRSKRAILSARIGMLLNPKLRLMVCEDGSDLDLETLEGLEAVLKEFGFQMLLEVVTRGKEDEDRCAVVIRDGRIERRPESQSA